MRKLCIRVSVCALIVLFAWFGTLLSDRQRLKEELIRIHVVANSNSPQDQKRKLQVRDAVLRSIQTDLRSISDAQEAKAYLQKNLPKIRKIAEKTLKSLGYEGGIDVTLQQESFGQRENGLIALPAGIYESLRIIIGSGQGENWWSVVFPDMCSAASSQEEAAEMVAGFSDNPEQGVSGNGYTIRFYFLDVLGRLENIFFDR